MLGANGGMSLKELCTNIARKNLREWQLFWQNDLAGQIVKRSSVGIYVIYFKKVVDVAEESSEFRNNMGVHPENWLYIDGCVFLGKG